MAIEFFKQRNITPFVQICGAGLQLEALLGGIDLKLFQETGKQEYLVENSFMAHEYVIMEEMLDTPLHILEQLKDILSSKKFRNGNQVYELKTKVFVVCTNRSKEEVTQDNSIAALMERFPLTLKVEWQSYMKKDYEELFRKVIGNPLSELATLIELALEKGNFISPRTAINAAHLFNHKGTRGLKYIEEFPYNEIQEMAKMLEKKRKDQQIIDTVTRDLAQLKAVMGSFNESAPIDNNIKIVKQANHLYKKLTATSMPDEIYQTAQGELKTLHDLLTKQKDFVLA